MFEERVSTDRLQVGLPGVRRTFDHGQLSAQGDTAILNGTMTERGIVGGEVVQHIAVVSQMWRRDLDRWRLATVRILSEDR